MKLFGLTGGIGMGKSTSARFFSQRGIAIIDTDDLARRLVEPGEPSLQEIKESFGADIIDSAGKLRREILANKVFSDPTALQRLESILHPRIRKIWKAKVEEWRNNGQSAGVVVIPLLFETNAQSEFDSIICIACSGATQQKRLRERGWSAEQIQPRLSAQWPMEKKIAQSNVVIWTDSTLETHAAQIDQFLSAEVCR
jgi:dephospho-CoA kinase